jgi:hypothetical protein
MEINTVTLILVEEVLPNNVFWDNRMVQIWLSCTTATIKGLLTNQMCLIYPINQSDAS